MLSKNEVVKVRRVLERGYIGRFTVTEHQEYTKPNHTTGFRDVDVIFDKPCRLSFTSAVTATDGAVAEVSQKVKLFCSPDFEIREGSKITVTQNGITTAYKRSGVPSMYATHQEILLDLFERWA